MAVKAINNTASPNGLVNTLLFSRAYLRISKIVTDFRHCIETQDRHLEGSKTATLYIDLQINIACRSLFPFQLPITPLYLIASAFFVYI